MQSNADILKQITDALAPCMTDPPAASAIVLVNSEKGTEMYSLNMDWLERVNTLGRTAQFLSMQATEIHDEPRAIQ